MRRAALLLLASALIGSSNAQADWNVDPGPSGLHVASDPYRGYAVISDGAGGAFICFAHDDGGTIPKADYTDLQRLDSQGLLPWGPQGVAFGGPPTYYGSTSPLSPPTALAGGFRPRTAPPPPPPPHCPPHAPRSTL